MIVFDFSVTSEMMAMPLVWQNVSLLLYFYTGQKPQKSSYHISVIS